MKKNIISGMRFFGILLATLISFCASAQNEGQIAIGYSGRDIAKSSVWGAEESGSVSASIQLDPQVIAGYENLKICGVSAGLASRINVDKITVWVRSSLSGENLVEASADAKKGWNDITFEKPFAVEGTECFVGYTLELADGSYPVSVVDGESKYGFFLDNGNGWTTPETDQPVVLSLLAIVEADNLLRYDLSLDKVVIPERIKIGAQAPVQLTLSNAGCKTVSGADILFYENNEKSGPFKVECKLAPGQTETVTIDYTPVGTARMNNCPLKIEIASLTEGADESESNNTFEGNFNLCKFDFTKRVFLEEFTTQLCVNCPRAAEMIHELIYEPKYVDKIVAVARHVGFGTDIFTSDIDREMLVMYGESGGTFAPAVMLDRTPFYSNGVPVMSVPTDKSDFMTYIDRCLANKASVDIVANAEYDAESGKLKVTVSGGRDTEFGNTPARLSVYLVENEIYDNRQTGADDYYQQHVVRDGNSTWGELIEWNNDDEFTYTCEFDVAKVLDITNCEIIAAVHDYDAESIANRIVNNAVSSKDIDWKEFSAIDSVSDEAASVVSVEYYDLNGLRITDISSYKGIILRKTVLTANTVKVDKVVL